MSSVPFPAPNFHSATAQASASFFKYAGTLNLSVSMSVIGTSSQPGRFGGPKITPVLLFNGPPQLTPMEVTCSFMSSETPSKISFKVSSLADETFTITSGTDAIHSEDTDEDTKGFVYITGGVLTLAAGGDGISSSYVVQADGGSFDISTSSTETDTSTKGIKAQKYVILKDGTYQLATADDGIHCNGNVYVCGGTYSINSGDDGIHADDQTVVLDGKIDITNCYEGIEGQSVTIQDGTIKIVSSDDGLNAAGGNDQSSMGRPGENTFQEDSDAYIDILGGTIEIDAKGDGIDSNGDFSVSGGVIYVSGPGDDGNGALDYDGTATITGGTVVAAGMSGMAQNFGSDSTQGTMLINLDTDQSGEITLKDTDGTVLVSLDK